MSSKWIFRIVLTALVIVPLAVPAATTALFGSAMVASPGGGGGGEPAGQVAFVDQKCSMCHGVEAAGIEATTKSDKMKGPDLSDVGARHDADWLVGYVKQQETLDGEEHKKSYKGTDEELEAIVDWLVSLEG